MARGTRNVNSAARPHPEIDSARLYARLGLHRATLNVAGHRIGRSTAILSATIGACIIGLGLTASASFQPAAVAVGPLDEPASAVVETTAEPAGLVAAPSFAYTVASADLNSAEPVATVASERGARPSLSNRTGQRTEDAPTPVATPTPRSGVIEYVVAEGDTVSTIAEKYGISSDTIVNVNTLANAEQLSIGRTLRILPYSGSLHKVAAGDTISDLANQYGVIPEDIVVANRLGNADALRLDQELVIPAGGAIERPTPTPAAGAATSGKPTTPSRYQVAAGDTLSGIADKFGVSTDSLVWANQSIGSGDSLKVGQFLTVPPVSGVLHTVVSGDTLNGLATKYDVSEADILKVNNLTEPYTLQLGQVVVVPGATPPPAPAPVAAAPAPAARTQPAAAPAAAAPAAPRPSAPAPAAPAAAPAASAAAPSAANVAMKYIGWSYVWGGSSPSAGGFDCSGLTYYAFRQAGRPIPRDLGGQIGSGARVSRANLQVGDLVFFQNTYTAGLSHVGIYVGGGRFVHAGSQVTGVLTSSLNDAYWSSHYYGASRP